MSKQLKDPSIWYAVKDWVETHIQYSALGQAALQDFSINEEWPLDTIDKSQRTGMITAALSQLFEKAVYRTLREAHVDVKSKADSGGDITINGEPWEIKTSQGINIQGATHSAQKPPRYIMIKYKLDYDKPLSLENNKGIITEFGMWKSESIQPSWWRGKPTKRNSRTTLRVPADNAHEIISVIGEVDIKGSSKRKKNLMFCSLVSEVIDGSK